MRAVLLVDFGSTYTKATAVDLNGRAILATASAFTTAGTDISEGLSHAREKLRAQIGDIQFEKTLACSSAAGGLKMIACGLVPSLTAEAARRAALGAGAKIIGKYSYRLTDEDAQEIEQKRPEIFLLTGGTDGGNTENILENARVLAGIKTPFPVIIAGNRAAAKEARHLLEGSAHQTIVTENVMPAFGTLNIEPAQRVIRNVFLERIVRAKGLSRVTELIGDILMPTPAAVLCALSLLSKGTEEQKGLGELVAVDLGGATTDIYSIASGDPKSASTLLHGLPEPFEKRTVEGDIGMRWSARGVVSAAGLHKVRALSGLNDDEIEEQLKRIEADVSILPDTQALKKLDFALAALAVGIGLTRHAGTLAPVYTPMGMVYQQTGKDLTDVKRVILTGGALIHAEKPDALIKAALSLAAPESLSPRAASPVLDDQYVLSAMGLLAQYDEKTAFHILNETFGKEL